MRARAVNKGRGQKSGQELQVSEGAAFAVSEVGGSE